MAQVTSPTKIRVKANSPHRPKEAINPSTKKSYSPHELYELLGSNGFKGAGLAKGIAIVLAESSGNVNARNVNKDGSIDRGLWQINKKWHPEVSDACAYNPQCSTQAAFRISKGGTDFSQWSTDKTTKPLEPKDYLPNAGDIPENISDGPIGQAAKGGLDGIKAIGAFFLALLQKDTWIRILKVAGGLTLVVIGIIKLTDINPVSALPMGRALGKVAK